MVEKSKIKQRLYEISIGFLLALAVMGIWNLVHHKENQLFSDVHTAWFLFCLVMGTVLIWKRKFTQKPASKILSQDNRPPVLYLRSFKDDKTTSTPMKGRYWPIFYTEEEYLIDVLHDFGPCIAVGRPGEKLPELGAARMYLENDVWQERVRELLISSKLVVLRAGATQNFLWEVEQSAKSVRPKNIIVLIPRVKNFYEDFRVRANQYFPKPLPESTKDLNFVSGVGSLHGYIYFDDAWTPHFVKFQAKVSFGHGDIVDWPEYVIRSSFTPVYEHFGMPAPKLEGSNLGVLLAAFVVSLVCLIILNQ